MSFDDAIDLYNSWSDLKKKEFVSVVGSTIKNALYYAQHPQEHQSIINEANKLFADYEKAKKAYDGFRLSLENHTKTLEEINKDSDLFQTKNKASQAVLFYCMNHAIPETVEIIRKLQESFKL